MSRKSQADHTVPSVRCRRTASCCLGLEEHQAVTVAHKDRDHNHTHTAVNRVSTIDGRAVKLQQSGRRLSAWAEQYEREHGGIRIPNRVERRQILNEPRKPNERRRKLPPMQRRTGPGRRPRLPAELREWNRHYQRQRAAAEIARQAGRKPDPAVERRRRVRLARRQRMIRPVRVGIAAGQTAVTALGRTTTRRIRSAATRARTTAIATTRRIQSVAATITPRPRTDAELNERANRRALAHVNQDRPPGVRAIVTAGKNLGAAAVGGLQDGVDAVANRVYDLTTAGKNLDKTAPGALLGGLQDLVMDGVDAVANRVHDLRFGPTTPSKTAEVSRRRRPGRTRTEGVCDVALDALDVELPRGFGRD